MAKKLTYELLNVDVQKVETVFDTYAGARRNPPAGTLSESGRIVTNVEGAEEWRAFFQDQGISPDQPWITTGTNRALGLVFMYAATPTTPGAIEVKFDAKAGTYATHFGAAFLECPSLRPKTTVEVQWKAGLDKDKKPFLAVNVKAAKAKRAGAADAETLIARAQEEAAKKAVKAETKKKLAAAKQGGAPAPEAAKATPPTEAAKAAPPTEEA